MKKLSTYCYFCLYFCLLFSASISYAEEIDSEARGDARIKYYNTCLKHNNSSSKREYMASIGLKPEALCACITQMASFHFKESELHYFSNPDSMPKKRQDEFNKYIMKYGDICQDHTRYK